MFHWFAWCLDTIPFDTLLDGGGGRGWKKTFIYPLNSWTLLRNYDDIYHDVLITSRMLVNFSIDVHSNKWKHVLITLQFYCIIATICSLFQTVFRFNFPMSSPPPFFIRYEAPNYPFLSTPKKCWQSFNPLTPRSDQLPISPYNITSESNMVMRIKEMIFNLLSSWFLNKFSLSVLQEMYRAWQICILMVGYKGLKAQSSFSLC